MPRLRDRGETKLTGPDFVPIGEAAEHLDMTARTIARMIEAGTLTGYVDWREVEAKLLPVRRPQRYGNAEGQVSKWS